MTKLKSLLLLFLLPYLAACSATSPSPGSGPAAAQADVTGVETIPTPTNKKEVSDAVVEDGAVEETVEYGNFSREQLELALLSEVGGIRGHLYEAADGYLELALETEDAGIVRRAVEFASVQGDTDTLDQLAGLWLKLEPNTSDPHLLIGSSLVDKGLYVQALPHLETALSLGGSVDFTALSARTYALENRQREVIIDQLSRLQALYPDEATLYYALAQLYDQNENTDQASGLLADARERFGDNPRTALLQVQLLQNMGRTNEAETALRQAVETYPESRMLRYSLAQLLLQNNLLAEAAIQFTELLRREPQDMETLYSLALINLELDQLQVAEAQFRDLLRAGHRRNEANFYLAYVLENRGQPEQALQHYQQIRRQSNAFLSAQRQIMRLFVELDQFAEADAWVTRMEAQEPSIAPAFAALQVEVLLEENKEQHAQRVLDAALQRYPDNVELLFTRALLNESHSRLDQAEKDLQRIILLQPDNARALNHLGYTLTERTSRYQEALALIEHAIALNPDDPATRDSLGWVQFKLGQYDKALQNLQLAYDAFPDPEVAAHLGEVLWVTGERREAMEIWQQALETDPQSEHVLEVMERLEADS